jgi:fructose-1,6-bisphosphatase I
MTEAVQNTETRQDLASFLSAAAAGNPALAPVAETVLALAAGAVEVAGQIALGPLSLHAKPASGSRNIDGDVQQALDLLTNQIFMDALAKAPVAVAVSEELDAPLVLNAGAPLVIAIDPLDGSSNIAVNVSVGTIFSILPAIPGATSPAAQFFQPGRNQLAAGFIVYGPQTLLLLSLGGPTASFILDPRSGTFVIISEALAIPQDSHEYAINASNYRHWDPGVRAFIDDCIQGELGRIGRNHNMRWVASMVADAYRIFTRGGVFLYPGDQRKGYASGRLRLLYEVSPLAFLVEHAGGGATDGRKRILDIVPSDLHERSPFVFGSALVVDTITKYHTDPKLAAHSSPLFKSRGLMI